MAAVRLPACTYVYFLIKICLKRRHVTWQLWLGLYWNFTFTHLFNDWRAFSSLLFYLCCWRMASLKAVTLGSFWSCVSGGSKYLCRMCCFKLEWPTGPCGAAIYARYYKNLHNLPVLLMPFSFCYFIICHMHNVAPPKNWFSVDTHWFSSLCNLISSACFFRSWWQIELTLFSSLLLPIRWVSQLFLHLSNCVILPHFLVLF